MCVDKKIAAIKGTFSPTATHFHNFICSSRSAVGGDGDYVRPRCEKVKFSNFFLSKSKLSSEVNCTAKHGQYHTCRSSCTTAAVTVGTYTVELLTVAGKLQILID
jgi:hypothetical protein